MPRLPGLEGWFCLCRRDGSAAVPLSQVILVADDATTSLLEHPTVPMLIAGDASGRLHLLALPPSPR